MKVYRTEEQTVQVQSVTDILCDRCDQTTKGSMNFNGIDFSVSGAYDSTHFPDDGDGRFVNVCEKCAAEWFKTFRRNPLDRTDEPTPDDKDNDT